MREVFILGGIEGVGYAEIADTLEIPIGTVKSRMFNAVRRLREMLQPYWEKEK
jgi:RNA polymerase sigma-70 factor (ECF subfamily)